MGDSSSRLNSLRQECLEHLGSVSWSSGWSACHPQGHGAGAAWEGQGDGAGWRP